MADSGHKKHLFACGEASPHKNKLTVMYLYVHECRFWSCSRSLYSVFFLLLALEVELQRKRPKMATQKVILQYGVIDLRCA
jgi:hypothetical protein